MSWSGGDVPAGTAEVVVPKTVDILPIAATQSMSADFEVRFTGGTSGAERRVTLSQPTSAGSFAFVDCDVEASVGRVLLPKGLFTFLEPGEASLTFTSSGMRRIKADIWKVEASAPGLVTKNGALISASVLVTLSR
jgi:hypothetical protein